MSRGKTMELNTHNFMELKNTAENENTHRTEKYREWVSKKVSNLVFYTQSISVEQWHRKIKQLSNTGHENAHKIEKYREWEHTRKWKTKQIKTTTTKTKQKNQQQKTKNKRNYRTENTENENTHNRRGNSFVPTAIRLLNRAWSALCASWDKIIII